MGKRSIKSCTTTERRKTIVIVVDKSLSVVVTQVLFFIPTIKCQHFRFRFYVYYIYPNRSNNILTKWLSMKSKSYDPLGWASSKARRSVGRGIAFVRTIHTVGFRKQSLPFWLDEHECYIMVITQSTLCAWQSSTVHSMIAHHDFQSYSLRLWVFMCGSVYVRGSYIDDVDDNANSPIMIIIAIACYSAV